MGALSPNANLTIKGKEMDDYPPGIAVPPQSFYKGLERLEPGDSVPYDEDRINVIEAKALIDGTGARAIDHPVVVTRGRHISIIDRQGQIALPEGPNVHHYSFPDGYLLPGLIDSHTHLMFGVAGASYEDVIENDSDEVMLLRAAQNAMIHLKAGVTTLRENGARNKVTFNLREGARRGYVTAPRMLLCGRPVTVTGGHFYWCNQQADGVEGVRAAVRELVKDGADHIKIMASGGGTAITDLRRPSYTVEELRAIVDEAHNMGKPTTAHCLATGSIVNALDAGVDMIEHAGFIEPDGSYKFDPYVAERIAKQGTYISPTVQTGYRGMEALLNKQEREGLTPIEEERLEWTKAKCDSQMEFLGRLYKDWQVPIVSGTDAISAFGDYCIGLEIMAEAGMSNLEVIRSSTNLNAHALGAGEIVGSIEVGKDADLIVVDKNPLEDIKALRTMTMVMRMGKRIV